MIKIFNAGEGKVWKAKYKNWVGSDVLVLGKNDDISNYEPIDSNSLKSSINENNDI